MAAATAFLLAAAIQIQVGQEKSFQEALDEVVAIRGTNTADDIELVLAGKGYGFRKEVFIDNLHAPRGAGRLVIKAAPGAKPVFYGSLPVKGWKRAPKKVNGRSDVWEADVSDLDLSDQLAGLFVNGKRMRLARYPNYDPNAPYAGGWAYVPGRWISMYDFPGDEVRTEVKVGRKDWHDWSEPTEGIVTIFPRQRFGSSRVRVVDLDRENRKLLVNTLCDVARPGDSYFVSGFREELDAPGEWCHLLKEKKLLFIPPKGLDMAKAKITVPILPRVFNIKGAHNVTFEGIEFCAAARSVRAEGGSGLQFVGCSFHDFIGDALDLFWGTGHVVRDCDFYDLGAGAIHMTGGSRESLVDVEVENCYIHHVALETYCSNAIFMEGWGFRVKHCLMHDLMHWGIFHTGGMHEITDNRVHHYMLETEDGAAFYTCNQLGNNGTTIARNWISDGVGFAKCAGWGPLAFFQNAHGLYFDAGPGEGFIYDNVIERVSGMTLKMDGNHNQLVSNNVFTACGRTELLHWSYNMNMSGGDDFPAEGNRLVHNVWDYPACPNSIYVLVQGSADVKKNVFDWNVINVGKDAKWPHVQKMDWKEGWVKGLGADKNSKVVHSLHFKDPENGDFTLKNSALMKAMKLKPVVVTKSGLHVSKHRPKIPKEAEGAASHPEWFKNPHHVNPTKEEAEADARGTSELKGAKGAKAKPAKNAKSSKKR